ncbi:hypothetical protein GF345_05975 [Candidatus Woesearchaeota archaeon]|nr:hypothetical protein [Candidatus Woesearchaeota archaeon]
MVFLKDLFAKKPSKPSPEAPSDVPTEKIISLKDQGMTVNQIYETLQRQGYSLDQISQAMNQADLKEGALDANDNRGDNMPEQPTPTQMRPPAQDWQGSAQTGQDNPGQGGGNMPPPDMPPPSSGHSQAGPGQSPPPPSGMPPMDPPGMAGGSMSEERIHEIAEAIIEEKWQELIENVNRIVEWKDSTESRITKLEQKMTDIGQSFDKLHEGVLGKISEYDKGIVDIGVEIKALEKVFQKILPGFMENVNELSRITAKMKGGAGKK